MGIVGKSLTYTKDSIAAADRKSNSQFLKPLHRSSAIRYFTMSRADAEKHIQRNPHPDFKKVEADRQPWDKSMAWNIKQTIKPDWTTSRVQLQALDIWHHSQTNWLHQYTLEGRKQYQFGTIQLLFCHQSCPATFHCRIC